MFRFSKSITACVLLSFSPLCLADLYVGATGTMSEYNYADVSRGFGGQAFLGYKPTSLPLVFEAGYLNTGKSKIDNFNESGVTGTDLTLSFQGELLSVGYYGQFDRKGSGAFGRLGYYTGKSKGTGFVNGANVDNQETSNGVMFAIGVDWMLTRYFGFRADIGSLISVKDLPQLGSDHSSNVTIANVGLVFKFGGGEPEMRVSRRAAKAPYTAPAAAQQTDTPVGNGQAVAGAAIRSQPLASSAVTTVLQNGGAVSVSSRIDNADGVWRFVSSGDISGWIRESDLQSPVRP